MRRRSFIAGLGATAVLPLTASAQAPRTKLVAVLMSAAADDPDVKANGAAFAEGMRQHGWIGGSNIRFETRYGAGDADVIRKYAEEFAALAPDVILASGNAAMEPLLRAAPTIPLVFVNVADPVGAGFVERIARRAGHVAI